jgi:hypothetical protein
VKEREGGTAALCVVIVKAADEMTYSLEAKAGEEAALVQLHVLNLLQRHRFQGRGDVATAVVDGIVELHRVLVHLR